jgi:hypothetical protein
MIPRQVVVFSILTGMVDGFTIQPSLLITRTTTTTIPTIISSTSTTSLGMGLFDGVREAFSAPTLEQTTIDKERETPIDRWMGWSVVSESNQQQKQQGMFFLYK